MCLCLLLFQVVGSLFEGDFIRNFDGPLTDFIAFSAESKEPKISSKTIDALRTLAPKFMTEQVQKVRAYCLGSN